MRRMILTTLLALSVGMMASLGCRSGEDQSSPPPADKTMSGTGGGNGTFGGNPANAMHANPNETTVPADR